MVDANNTATVVDSFRDDEMNIRYNVDQNAERSEVVLLPVDGSDCNSSGAEAIENTTGAGTTQYDQPPRSLPSDIEFSSLISEELSSSNAALAQSLSSLSEVGHIDEVRNVKKNPSLL